MVRHVILWKLKEEHNTPEVKAAIKEHLESLVGVVPGLVSLSVHTAALPSSPAALCLDALLVDEAALNGYATHPAHVAAADTFVCPFVETRLCLDFEV